MRNDEQVPLAVIFMTMTAAAPMALATATLRDYMAEAIARRTTAVRKKTARAPGGVLPSGFQ